MKETLVTKTFQPNPGEKQAPWLRREVCVGHVREVPLGVLTSNGPRTWGKRIGITLIFLDLQVRQPVRVLRCVLRAEGLTFMPFMAAECSAPNRIIEDVVPEIAGKQANCQHLNPRYQYAVRVQPRHREGEALRAVMAAWARTREERSSYVRTNPRVEIWSTVFLLRA
jgi:hypothetical protein